jgi:hypothetical protein
MRSPLDALRTRRSSDDDDSGGPPDFIGVGALGSSTRWWHEMLLAHPEILPPRADRRALHFFDRFAGGELTAEDIAAYHRWFPRVAGKITGEWTGRYMFDAWTPPLLRRAAPQAKLLVIVSDPIERYRAILTDRLRRREDDEPLFMTDVVDRRSFASQLARLHRFYDADRILVLQLERCRRDPLGQYRRTLEFLGVRDLSFAPTELRRKAAGRPQSRLVSILLRLGLPAGTRRRVTPRRARPTAAPPRVPLWPDIEASLHVALDPEVEALAAMVPELDVSLWRNFAHLAAPERTAA